MNYYLLTAANETKKSCFSLRFSRPGSLSSFRFSFSILFLKTSKAVINPVVSAIFSDAVFFPLTCCNNFLQLIKKKIFY